VEEDLVKTFVKLSGVTDAESLPLAPEGGAVGFLVGVPGAPRNLEPARAAELVGAAPAGAEVWAVTRSPTAALVHQLFDEVGVDRVQVYGSIPEGLEFLEIHHLVPSLEIPRHGTTGPEPKCPRRRTTRDSTSTRPATPLRTGARPNRIGRWRRDSWMGNLAGS
jgi:hypothetical protein